MKKAKAASKIRAASKTKATPVSSEWDMPVAGTILMVCVLYAIWIVSIGWSNTLNDHHSFRQTQTAITAYYLKEDGFRLDYETPVLGKPWSTPLEFPLYQWVAARLSSIFDMPLDQSGRFVSFVFFLLLAAPLYQLLGRLKVSVPHRFVMLSILLTSPFYLFWSRTFMIESTALFCCFAYLSCLSMAMASRSVWLGALTVLIGALAGLTKITTWLPFLLCSTLMITRDYWCWSLKLPDKQQLRRFLPPLLIFCGIPFLIAFWWVKYTDHFKDFHPLAYTNTSANTHDWVFGTLSQKLSWKVWEIISIRACMVLGMPVPMWTLFFICAIALGLTRRRWKEACACLGLFLLSPIIFTNLHFIHDYYMNANGIFLLGFFAFSVVALLEGWRTYVAGWVLLGAILVTAMFGHRLIFEPAQEEPHEEIRKVAEYVKENTSKDGVIICLGFDYSPLVPYYCERRALMIPDWDTLTEASVEKALENLRGCNVEALVIMEPHHYSLETLQEQIKKAGFAPKEITIKGFPQR